MTAYNFGKDITRSFYPLEDNEPINLPSQSPSIYLFEDQPSIEEARSGVGAIAAAIAYWTESGTAPYARTYTIPAIPDPNPESATPTCLGYWEAVNYVAQVSGQVQTKLRTIELQKGKATESVPGATYTDLLILYPEIDGYVEAASVLTGYIDLAEDLIKLELRSFNIDWGDVESLKDLRIPSMFLAIKHHAQGQLQTEGDKWDIRAKICQAEYDKVMADIKIKYDSDGDGLAESVKENGVVIGYR